MLNANAIRFIVGVIGNVISFALFLSPSPTFYGIIKKKSVEEFSPVPYIATTLNCVLWVFYGIIHPNSILVATINGVGLVIELAYVLIFFIYATNKGRKSVAYYLLVEVIFFAAIVLVTLLAFHDVKSRSLILGIVCDLFNVLMYASPLIVVRRVVETKSVKYMPFWLSLTNFLNACVWTAYALIKLDLYVLISNGIGTVFGIVQLLVYGIYYRTTPKEDDDVKAAKPSEVELSANNDTSIV